MDLVLYWKMLKLYRCRRLKIKIVLFIFTLIYVIRLCFISDCSLSSNVLNLANVVNIYGSDKISQETDPHIYFYNALVQTHLILSKHLDKLYNDDKMDDGHFLEETKIIVL